MRRLRIINFCIWAGASARLFGDSIKQAFGSFDHGLELARDDKVEWTTQRRQLDTPGEQPVDFGVKQLGLSSTIAGQAVNTSISWTNSNVTAFRCDIERFTGPVQVLHEEPIEHNSIELVYFTFDGSGSQGFYSLDNYSADINSIISDLDGEQADRATMYSDTDLNGSNYPLAAFLFNEILDEDFSDPHNQNQAQPVRLCRFDAIHLECFNKTLQIRGENTQIPFVGIMLRDVYFYANGLGNSDLDGVTKLRMSRPLFRVLRVNEDEPFFDETEYYIKRTDNGRMRCADLTAFNQLGCVLNDGTPTECVQTNTLSGTSGVVPLAKSFLSCIMTHAVGIILVALDDNLTPFAYNWVEGVDLIVQDGNLYTPISTSDGQTVADQPVQSGENLGSFGACFVINPLESRIATQTTSTRIFCASNKGFGLFEVALPIEMGYCESSWHAVGENNGEVNGVGTASTCKRFPPMCSACDMPGGKPKIGYVSDSEVTTRNDGLNCQRTLFDVPGIYEAGDSPTLLVPTLSPAKAPMPLPTSSPTAATVSAPTLSPSAAPVLAPTSSPTAAPTQEPTPSPSATPIPAPASSPSAAPVPVTTHSPSAAPIREPTASPSTMPVPAPTHSPSALPIPLPTHSPSVVSVPATISSPSAALVPIPTPSPSSAPVPEPTPPPSAKPESTPTASPSDVPVPVPTFSPTSYPSSVPASVPTSSPSAVPVPIPTPSPSGAPMPLPTSTPSAAPAPVPTSSPSELPVPGPTSSPTAAPFPEPTRSPSMPAPTSSPSAAPVPGPTPLPSVAPVPSPTSSPSLPPVPEPTLSPSAAPEPAPTSIPSITPVPEPTISPSAPPVPAPTSLPSVTPVPEPTLSPSAPPLPAPTSSPSVSPVPEPTLSPSAAPMPAPTSSPSAPPVPEPTLSPSAAPVPAPTSPPSGAPVPAPTFSPSIPPVPAPTSSPSVSPVPEPTRSPSAPPLPAPTSSPSVSPVPEPTLSPSAAPMPAPTSSPSAPPVPEPTLSPSAAPVPAPTSVPSVAPVSVPTVSPSIAPVPAPTSSPSASPIPEPTLSPSAAPMPAPTPSPSASPVPEPTLSPSAAPMPAPTSLPSTPPVPEPTLSPSAAPVPAPTSVPSAEPVPLPTFSPSTAPVPAPTSSPSKPPVLEPTLPPSAVPVPAPTPLPSASPVPEPTLPPSAVPLPAPTPSPSASPVPEPTLSPSAAPMPAPTSLPSTPPVPEPTLSPSAAPVPAPTSLPSALPVPNPTTTPSAAPVSEPTSSPSAHPMPAPTLVPSTAHVPEPTSSPVAWSLPAPTSACPGIFIVIDFEGLVEGEKLSMLSEGSGITVVSPPGDRLIGSVNITADSNSIDSKFNAATVFDATCVPPDCAGGDNDLSFPDQGKILIINENMNGIPDDSHNGGTLIIDFRPLGVGPVEIERLIVLDLDATNDEKQIKLSIDGNLQREIDAPSPGNHKSAMVEIGSDADVLTFVTRDSFALDDIEVCIPVIPTLPPSVMVTLTPTEAPIPAPTRYPTFGPTSPIDCPHPTITHFQLINAETDEVVEELVEKATVYLEDYDYDQLNVKAVACGETESVLFKLSKVQNNLGRYSLYTRLEKYEPYALFGNSGTDYYPVDVNECNVQDLLGVLELVAYPYSTNYPHNSTLGTSRTVSFEVRRNRDGASLAPATYAPSASPSSADFCSHPQIKNLWLVDPVTDIDIQVLNDDDQIYLDDYFEKELFNVRAEVCGFREYDSVYYKIYFDDYNKKLAHDSTAPYSLFGDNGNVTSPNYYPGDLYLNGRISIDAYALRYSDGQYSKYDHLNVHFTVHDSREAAANGLEVFSFSIVNADTNSMLREIQGGEVIDVTGIEECNFQASVSTDADAVKFWVLNEDGANIERFIAYDYPYTAFGHHDVYDNRVGGTQYNGHPCSSVLGYLELKAKPYEYNSQKKTWEYGIARVINFTLIQM